MSRLSQLDERRTARLSPTAGRLPPHDLDAERALLGAMLLTRQAIWTAAEHCTTASFYKPAHAHIYDAITALSAEGEPTDPVSVAARLHTAGLLETVGGLTELVALQADTPSTASAGRYARIIAEHAQAREAIAVGQEVIDAAYQSRIDDARSILDRARTLIEPARAKLVLEPVADIVRGDLPEIVPTIFQREDGQALIYPGLSHSFAGEPTSGKTMTALVAAAQLLAAGGRVLMVDYEGNRRVVGSRLRALGADPDTVGTSFHYLRPPTLDAAGRDELGRVAADIAPDLVIVDGVAKGIARQGGNEDVAADFLAWVDTVIAPLTLCGAAVLMLDHVTKAKEGRGRWARGTGAKLGEIEGAAFGVDAVQKWSRTRPGRVHLRLEKDREGVLGEEGAVVAVVTFTPSRDGLAVRVIPPDTMSVDCEAAVLEVLGSIPCASQKGILDEVREMRHRRGLSAFRDSTVIEVLEVLVASGRVRESKGARNARMYELRRD